MPNNPQSTIARGVAANQALIASGQKVYSDSGAPVQDSTQGPPQAEGPKPALPVVSGLPVRGVFSPTMALATDIVNTSATDGIPQRSTIPPPQIQSSVSKTTVKQTTIISGGSSSSGPLIEVDNTPVAVQSKVNFIGQNGFTFTSDGSGNIFGVQGPSGSSITGPGFINLGPSSEPAANVALTNFINGANGVGGILFFLPTIITTGHIIFKVNQTDSTNSYDIGIYGPFTGVETSLPLVVNVGSTIYSSLGATTKAWSQGSTTIEPGFYFMFVTTSGSSLVNLDFEGFTSTPYLYHAYSTTTSSSSTLPATANVPSASATYVYGTAGANIPQQFQFMLVP
jgi:hypothetical protein